jgi:ComF family protein
MKTGFKEFSQSLKWFCFPSTCLICRTRILSPTSPLICQDCQPELRTLTPPFCPGCGMPFPNSSGPEHYCSSCLQSLWHFDMARSIFIYKGSLLNLIHNFKYSGTTTALSTFADYMNIINPLKNIEPPDLIIPVPLHITRLHERGFNQAVVLAKIFFPKERKKIKTELLIRKRKTIPQTGLSENQRRNNLKNAFSVCDPSQVKEKTIILVDDVFTTGTTVNECCKLLKRCKAKKIIVLTLARAVKE